MAKKRIITIAAIMLAIAVALVALNFLDGSPADDESHVYEPPPEPAMQPYVLGANQSDAPIPLTIKVQGEDGNFTIVSDKPEDLAPFNYILMGFEDVSLRFDELTHVAAAAERLVALDIIHEGAANEQAANLADFGLAHSRATAAIEYADGTFAELLIGNDAPGGSGVYAMRAGEPDIYLISAAQAGIFLRRAEDFVDATITEFPDDMPEMERILLDGSVRPEPVIMEAVPLKGENDPVILTSHLIVHPIKGRLHGKLGFEPILASYGLTADRVEARFDSPDELAEWGLLEPYSILEITGQAHDNHMLFTSAPDENGLVYIVRDGRPLVYSIQSDRLPWLELSYFDIMDKLLALPMIDSVSLLEIHTPDATTHITLEGVDSEMEVFIDGVPYETKDGVDPLANFRNLYLNLISTRYDSIPDAPMPPDAPILLQFVYNYRDARPPDTVTIYEGAARRVYVGLNDETPMLGLSTFTDHLLQSISAFLAGEAVENYY